MLRPALARLGVPLDPMRGTGSNSPYETAPSSHFPEILPLKKEKVPPEEQNWEEIAKINDRLSLCRNRNALKTCVRRHVLPLLKAQSAAFWWRDTDFPLSKTGGPAFADCIGLPKKEYGLINQTSLCKNFLDERLRGFARPVLTYEIDKPQKQAFQRELDSLLKPARRKTRWKTFERMKSMIFTGDPPDFSAGFVAHRLSPCNGPFALGDIRALEQVRSGLLQAVKSAALGEEFAKHARPADALRRVPCPAALVDRDLRPVLHNRLFHGFLGPKQGRSLRTCLLAVIREELPVNGGGDFFPKPSCPRIPFYKYSGGTVRLVLDAVAWPGGVRYLVRIKPVDDGHSKTNLKMQEASLTGKEMEVACLVHDGFSDQEMADRLRISLHTVNAHLKKIYRKSNVRSRAQLIAWLNHAYAPEYR